MSRQLTMVQQAHAYLEHRRALGFRLEHSGGQLLHFARFADRSGRRGPLTANFILRWAHDSKLARSSQGIRLSIARCFARYLAARDGRTEVPDRRLIPKALRHRPHIFSEWQLEQLLVASSRMKPSYELRPLTYLTLFGLLASTGLRVSEAVNLTRGQVDLKRSFLRIERTKFKKSRFVPLHPTVTRALRRYAAARDRRWGQHAGDPFFVGRSNRGHRCDTVQGVFRGLCAGLGWHRGNGEWPRPRLHDLRHSFACRRLLRWYRDGENVHQRMASLSTYLGHAAVTHTYWYLTGTPELMAIVGSRFERFASPAGRRRT